MDGNLKAGCLAGRMVVIVHWGKGCEILWAKAVFLRCFSISPLKMCQPLRTSQGNKSKELDVGMLFAVTMYIHPGF